MSAKFCTLVLVLVFKTQSSLSDENRINETTEILFNLTNYAIGNYATESRRVRNPCAYETNDINYFTCMKQLTASQDDLAQHQPIRHQHPQRPYHPSQNFDDLAQPQPIRHQHPQRPYHPSQNFVPYPQTQNSLAYPPKPHRPYPYPYPSRPSNNPQGLVDVLDTISKNDALRCVPRLLCEVTSDTMSRGRQGFTLPTLPFNLDMASIIRLLSMIDLPGGSSPIPFFAKAALLGYVSKGNSDSCIDAYPTCPREPDKLVQYLNNYNGGFFRYFNGVTDRPSGNYGLINYPRPYPYQGFQERIQTRPGSQISTATSGVVFAESNNFNRAPKTLSFPTEDNDRFSEFAFKKPKELPFSINDYYSNELDLQRPLPNHKATPLIFPLRTGTGDLRLDAEDLNADYKQKYYNHNNFVSFGSERPGSFYYQEPQGVSDFTPNKAIFSFPV